MALDPLHAMQFRPDLEPEVRCRSPAQRCSPSDRECPLDTAGDRCLWHAGGMAGENVDVRTWRRRLQVDCWVRPVRGDACLVGKPRRRRGSWLPLGHGSFEASFRSVRSVLCSPGYVGLPFAHVAVGGRIGGRCQLFVPGR
jgi:hypothetical protein